MKCLACTKKRKRENKLPGGTLENCNLSVETAAPLTLPHNRLSDSSSESQLGSYCWAITCVLLTAIHLAIRVCLSANS